MSYESLTSSTGSEAGTIAEIAAQAATVTREPQYLLGEETDRPDVAVFLLRGEERLETYDLEAYAEHPARKKGMVRANDAASFAEYVNRHSNALGTTLWANDERALVTAVLDDHTMGADQPAGWGQHRAVLELRYTPEWAHWTRNDGRMVSQSDFAEHLEDGAEQIVTPSAADMLEIAQSFHAKNNVNFRSAARLDSGEVQLQYEETIQAKAGQRGQLTIPTSFEIGLAPYIGSDAYRMLARFRYRLHDGRLTLGYKLIRPDVVQRSAFDDVVKHVSDAIELPVIKGTPRP